MGNPKIGYQNLLDTATVTALTTASGYHIDNLKDWRVYTYWKGTGAAQQEIKIDNGAAAKCDYLALVSHDLNTQGVTNLAFQYSTDDISYFDCFTPFTPSNDKLIFKEFTQQNARYYKLIIPAGYTAAPFIGIMAAGESLDFPTGLRRGFDPTFERLVARSTRSQRGHLLGAVVDYSQRRLDLEFHYVSPTWIDTYFNPFWDNHASKLKPFIWSWNPDNNPGESYLVSITEEADLERSYRDNCTFKDLRFSILGIKE